MQDDIRDTRDRARQPEPRATEPHIGPEHQLPPPQRSAGIRILVWLIILLAFGLLFWWVLHHRQAPPRRRRQASRCRAAPSPSTSRPRNKAAYRCLPRRHRHRHPVYTDTIVSQVTGVISQVRYREGQLVTGDSPWFRVDPRPFQAQVLTAQGALERDTNLLAQAEMDLKRYQDAWARNAIPKQTLDDQEKLVLQDTGTVKADQGTLQYDQVQLAFTNITAPIYRPRRSPPGRSG
jgi:multidrug efflux system membrane fusion protein